MSTTDALTITSAPDALTKYYDAKEREENAVLYINDAYLEVLNSLEKLEAENAKLLELVNVMAYCNQFRRDCDGCSMNGAAGIITERAGCDELLDRLRDLGIEVEP